MAQHKLYLPWKVVQNYRGKLAVVDARNDGKDVTSGRVFNLPQGKDGQGRFVAEEICRTMNARLR